MKKLMIAAAIVCAAACVQAAGPWWQFSVNSPITGTDGTGLWTGTATITCVGSGGTAFSTDVEVASGNLSSSWFDSEGMTEIYKYYNLTLSLTEGDYTYSQTVMDSPVMNDFEWQESGRPGQQFGTAKFAGGNAWVESVPEPTSGLLMLLGLAGLALKRKRA